MNNKKFESKNNNAVIYARYSSSGQHEESIEGQLRECRAYAASNDIRIIGEYIDRALTGTSDKRPEFQRMIKDSSRGQFSMVIVWKNDRFARNRYDSAIYKNKLKQNGVAVISAMEAIPKGPEGILLESMMEGWAEYYSADLSQKVKRSNYDHALKHETLGQKTYGLRTAPDKTWEIDPTTAPVVRRIFEEYAAGVPAKEIYTKLNSEGYRTVNGTLFDKSYIRRILQNEKYYGVYKHADIRDEGVIPPIVSKELFDKVQKMIDIHHRSPAAKKTENGFLLTGKLFCGECGEMMTGDGGTSASGTVYSYYTCNGHRKKKCDLPRISKYAIEDAVVSELMRVLNDSALVETFADKFMNWQERNNNNSDVVNKLESDLRRVEAAIGNTLSVIDAGLITDSLKTHLLELEAQRVDLENGIAHAKIKDPKIEREQIIWFMEQFRTMDQDDPGWRIYLVDTFLRAAYLYKDGRLLLNLNFTGKEAQITAQLAEQALSDGEPICSSFAPTAAPDGANLNPTVIFFGGALFILGYIRK